MRRALPALALLAVLVLGACSSGSTEVSGTSDGGSTAATGSTATGATASTGTTGTTGSPGDLAGPVSIDLSSLDQGGFSIERAFFSCDGVLSTWTYIFKADFGAGVTFDIDSSVDLSSGSGTLVFGDTIEIPQVGSIEWEDTVDLVVAGTADAPTIKSTNATAKITGGSIPIPPQAFEFPEHKEFPVVAGSDRC